MKDQRALPVDGSASAPLRLQLFGGLRVTRGDAVVRGFVSVKAQALLAYLAVTGQAHSREALADLFWGERPEAKARLSLRQVLHNLRGIVGPALDAGRDLVSLRVGDDLWVDVAAFLALLAPPGEHANGERLGAALRLYNGEFLAGFGPADAPDFDEWAAAERARLRRFAVEALHTLGEQAIARHDWSGGITSLTRLLTLEPWREDTHRRLMLLLASNGQRDAALAHYRTYRNLVAAELGGEPAAETTALYRQIVAGTLVVPTASARLAPVPSPLTPLLGRAGDLRAIDAALAEPGCRLLTLIGPGGIGKTRLALALAARQRDRYGDDIAFVDLTAITDPALVGPALAEALALPQMTGQPLIRLLHDALCDRHLLLILDNCEQVIAAAPLLAELLETCPDLRVLATSRTPWRVRGESLFPVAPLTLPAQDGAHDAQRVGAAHAVALFVARARAVRPEFALTDQNAAMIAAIVARVDGLPLAIELAAARIALLTPAAILARLGDQLGLLSGGARDLPARQQTMRNAIAWSYDLLDPPAQRLFRALGTFAGGTTVEAIGAVCGADTPHTDDATLESLTALLDQSLLQPSPGRGPAPDAQPPRFAMLATIRTYAREQLAAHGEEAALGARHAAHFLALAEAAEAALNGPSQLTWLDRLERDHDNLRAALDWCQEAAPDEPTRASLGLRLAGALWPYWEVRGYLNEGRYRLAAALTADTAATPWRGKALLGAGQLARQQADYPAATALLQASLRCYEALGDRSGIAAAASGLGRVALDESDYETSRRQYAAALASATAANDQQQRAHALVGEGLVAYCLADYPTAVVALTAGLEIESAQGNLRGRAATLHRLSQVKRAQGDLGAARRLAEESLAFQRELASAWDLAYALNVLGNVARDQGDLTAANDYLTECLALQQRLGDRQGVAYTHHQLGIVARQRGDLDTAAALSSTSLATFRDLGHRRGIAYALSARAQVAGARGETEAAALLRESLAIHAEIGDMRGIAATLAECAFASAADAPAHAARLMGAAASLRARNGIAIAPSAQREEDQQLAHLRASLSASDFAAADAEGGAWSLAEAVTVALDGLGVAQSVS